MSEDITNMPSLVRAVKELVEKVKELEARLMTLEQKRGPGRPKNERAETT